MTKQEKIIVSAYTGVLMCDFGDVHKYIEKKLGRPVYTHELADKDIQKEVKEKSHEDFLEICNREEPEQKWIPCSERMPEESEWIGTKTFGTTISDEVYVTFESPDGQRFADHINFQNGKLSRSDEQRMKVIYKGAKPIAWMPLPEPYRGGDSE